VIIFPCKLNVAPGITKSEVVRFSRLGASYVRQA
jgi:hypothetical protein